MRFDFHEAKRSWENRAKSGKLQKHRLATVQKKHEFLSESKNRIWDSMHEPKTLQHHTPTHPKTKKQKNQTHEMKFSARVLNEPILRFY